MNEDEAFIRAIVDNPGDDTARLVYADWLDDRDDPRGAYLRAEREAVVSGDIKRLKELAVGLDPVWVARVSRPPIGVCIEHVEFVGKGPRLGRTELTAFERKHGVDFPDSYRAFVLNYNGGVAPQHEWRNSIYNWTLYPLRKWAPGDLGIGTTSVTDSLFSHNDYIGSHQVPQDVIERYYRFVAIGHDPDYMSAILLGVAGAEQDSIWLLDYLDGRPFSETNPRLYATSFPDFLSSLPGWR